MKREYYSDSITKFLGTAPEEIIGRLATNSDFPVEQTQRKAWQAEINNLRNVLSPFKGRVYFEYSIPRMGRRVDVVVLIGPVIFVLEYKVGEKEYPSHAIDQVLDYALDLKNFHESSHNHFIAPILIATQAKYVDVAVATTPQNDRLLFPIKSNMDSLSEAIKNVLLFAEGEDIEHSQWECGRYCPTPTIIEAAMALYNHHSVDDISRSDASAINLSLTSKMVSDIITETGKLCVPGKKGCEIDAVAREMLQDNGYEVYQPALGYQLGRDGHDRGAIIGPEWERYGITPTIQLEQNNVFTLELEIFLPGIGCVGLEEDICVTKTGAEFLSPRQMELDIK